ncbi:hypothetical protein A1Q1_03627 [Trichosporon asahii var. asahii CBS 2479]|uniref:Uncharacterized protein n=1 Tax=Trichosporon asahii var. asahii (strain ATCC 90039 / CBS 2479 / JCM 2466 / KCTC 7840 / NBRC 103889/ NCYC 2677 / UAMH 7654) TaxID=1186058 RepID=J4U9Z9_TRIAS|nr:hypothetical protein A1Q1_03627 [Trichosporon asahii var. asahii CBS 2479]EJT47515.1 hypothetical protein A1Q1_03627 [Trichosporon asahii var. asahii CBS 2479]
MLPAGYLTPVEQRPNPDQERYKVCHALHNADLPCVVFFEDAIAYHGVPSCLFDLYLLVSDVQAAAEVLAKDAAWVHTEKRKNKIGNSTVDVPQIRLGPPSDSSDTATLFRVTHVVLLRAADWFYDLHDAEATFFPPLVPLLNAFYRVLFEGTQKQRRWTSLQLSYLHGHTLNWRNWKDQPRISLKELAEPARPVHQDYRDGYSFAEAMRRQTLVRDGKAEPGRLGTDFPPNPDYESRYGVLPGPWSWHP